MFILSVLCIELKLCCLRPGPSSLLSQLCLYKAISQRQDVALKKESFGSAGQASSWWSVTNKPEKYVQGCQLTREAGAAASKAEQQ